MSLDIVYSLPRCLHLMHTHCTEHPDRRLLIAQSPMCPVVQYEITTRNHSIIILSPNSDACKLCIICTYYNAYYNIMNNFMIQNFMLGQSHHSCMLGCNLQIWETNVDEKNQLKKFNLLLSFLNPYVCKKVKIVKIRTD